MIGCRDAEELTETALLLAEQPLPAGPRLARPRQRRRPRRAGGRHRDPLRPRRARSSPTASAPQIARTSPAPSAPATRSTPARAVAPRTSAGSPPHCSRPTRSTRVLVVLAAPAPSTPTPTLSALAPGAGAPTPASRWWVSLLGWARGRPAPGRHGPAVRRLGGPRRWRTPSSTPRGCGHATERRAGHRPAPGWPPSAAGSRAPRGPTTGRAGSARPTPPRCSRPTA